MREQIVTCVWGQDTKQDLLIVQGLNLQKTKDTCRADEKVVVQNQGIRAELVHVDAIKVSETKKTTSHKECQFLVWCLGKVQNPSSTSYGLNSITAILL